MDIQKKVHRGTENLKPFKPGQSGNPAGKPKGATSITAALRALLDKEITLKSDPITGESNRKVSIRDMVTLALIKKASQGSEKAIEMILDRIDGKVLQQLEHTGVNIQLANILEIIKNPDKLLEQKQDDKNNEI